MPFVLGWIFGGAFARIAFSRAVVTLALWFGVFVAGNMFGRANISPSAGPVTAVLAPSALLAWALWRPATSRVRLWLLDGIYLWIRLAMFGCLIAIAWKLVSVRFSLVHAAPSWPYAIGGGVAPAEGDGRLACPGARAGWSTEPRGDCVVMRRPSGTER